MLRDKYSHAIQVAKGFRMQGAADERDGKLYFKGTVNSEDEKNRIWDAIKTVPDWRNDIVGEITVNPQAAPAAPAAARGGTTYTVKSGDTLSKIAKQLLGDANAYNAIFEANRDQLDDADKIIRGRSSRFPRLIERLTTTVR